jgi:transposase
MVMRGMQMCYWSLTAQLENQIVVWRRANENSRKLAKMPGIGPIMASAVIATLGDAKSFKNGRQVIAWLGLVPKHNSSGGKTMLLGMSKRGVPIYGRY